MEAMMSDQLQFPADNNEEEETLNILDADVCDEADDEDEYEEITSDEVDRVVSALEDLAESCESMNIRAYLDEAAANIYCLVYDEEDLEEAA